jgi:hypothetical protein
MSAAREKLLEAQYFLQRMRENSSDRDAFKYNLSAFLSAARSVRWFLKKEHENKPNFKQWWKSKGEWDKKGEKPSDITEPVRAANVFFDDKRRIAIHERSVRPRAHVDVEITERVTVRPSWEGVVIRADGTRERVEVKEPEPHSAPEPTDTEPTVEWRWYFEDLPPVIDEKDVITLSEEHVGRLEAFVSECESRFAP